MNTEETGATADERWATTMLTRAIGAEPRLGIQGQDLLTRARRDIARRRAALTGAVTVVGLVASGLALSHRGSPSGPQAGHPGSVTTDRVPASTPTATTVYGMEGSLISDARAQEMTAVLAEAHLVPPGVKASTDKYYGGQPMVFYQVPTGQNAGSYYAEATLTDSHGAGQVYVQVLAHQTGLNCVAASMYQQPCSMQNLPDGSHLTVYRYTQPPVEAGGRPTIQWSAELVHPDGTAVDASSGNWSMSGDPAVGGINHATGAEPPLGKDALVKLVELPGLVP